MRKLLFILCGLVCLMATAVSAQTIVKSPEPAEAPPDTVQLAGIFGDHMVLQRDAPIRVWGRAPAGEALQVSFRGETRHVRTDARGHWQTLLNPAPAGGPFELVVSGRTEQRLQDVLVGEVWVCAGQSNMEFTVEQAADAQREILEANHPQIRHFKIEHRTSLQPLQDVDRAPWLLAEPASVASFSAVGYAFARKLQQELRVPIGLVNVSWGGTHAETWTTRAALAQDPVFAPLMRKLPSNSQEWLAQQTERAQKLISRWQPQLRQGLENPMRWADADSSDADWPHLKVPQVWESQGLEGFDGYVWYRRTIELDEPQAASAATLHLGGVDDCDETWVNGRRIGGTCGWSAQRSYELPHGTLQAGSNVIAVRVTDLGGDGGFHGDAQVVRLDLGGRALPLAGQWKARIEAGLRKEVPDANDLPSVAFEGMVRGITPVRVRGVIWYQGESNVTRAARYAPTFKRLINDWRHHWQQPQLPFYFVQLASYLPLERNTLDGSAWAELRDAQRQALVLPRTGMAVATDLGDANDIHPKNKQDVGLRLALLALRGEYGRDVIASGPVFESMQVSEGGFATLNFSHAYEGLEVRGVDGTLRGFAVAGDDGQFKPAKATVDGAQVYVFSPAVPVPRAVRYGWVDNAQQANLYNSAGLPAAPFRTDCLPLTTEGQEFMQLPVAKPAVAARCKLPRAATR